MSLIWSNCCQENPCKPDCVVLYTSDTDYKANFERLFHPEETYQSGQVIDTDHDGLPDGIDRPYTFNSGKLTLSYTSSLDAFIHDGILDNIGIYLPISIQWSNEDQDYQEVYTITIGSLTIRGENRGKYYTNDTGTQKISIYVNGERVYCAVNKSSVFDSPNNSPIACIPQYIIRYNSRVYYLIDNKSIYEGNDNTQNSGSVSVSYSFQSSKIVSGESTSTPTQTVLVFGQATVSDYPIIWRPDKWQYFQEYQEYQDISSTSDAALETITDIFTTDRESRLGCNQPSNPSMVEEGVTFPRCLPDIGLQFGGFKDNNTTTGKTFITIPGIITSKISDGQSVPHADYLIADINAEAQTEFTAMTGSDNFIQWYNGATVSFDYDPVLGVTLNAVSGNTNTITFEPMNPIDVMVNSQAWYDTWLADTSSQRYSDEYRGFDQQLAYNTLSTGTSTPPLENGFKSCRLNPFDFFGYHFDDNGNFIRGNINRNAIVDNGFQLNNVHLTVFKGVIAPTIEVNLKKPLGEFNLIFETNEPYLSQEDIDQYNNYQWPTSATLKRAGVITGVTGVLGHSTGVTITADVLDSNFNAFYVDPSKKDNRPVIILQFADMTGGIDEKTILYEVTDQYGAKSVGTIYLHFVSDGEEEVTQFFESGEPSINSDYDLVCRVDAYPSMRYLGSGSFPSKNSFSLYYMHPAKYLNISDLVGHRLEYKSFQNTIIHNFISGNNITYSEWISWEGKNQDAVYADLVIPTECSIATKRVATYDDYLSVDNVPCPQSVDECVLSVSMYQGTADYLGNITWIPLPTVVGVIVRPAPITVSECAEIEETTPEYTGSGRFLVYTDPYSGDETWVIVPFSLTPLIPYNNLVIYSEGAGGNKYSNITKISTDDSLSIVGIRVDAITVHYVDGSTNTIDLSKWRDIGDALIK